MTTPTLDDTRVDAMRTPVMAAVDADVRTRGRRTRQVLVGAAAAALIVVAGGIGASLNQSGGDALTASDSSESASSASADSGSDSFAPSAVAPEGVVAPDADGAKAAPEEERQVIRTGSATVVVKDPRRETGRIIARVEALGGRVDSRNESGSGDTALAYLSVRVPTPRLTEAVKQLSESGEVVSVSLQNDDVTSTAVDLDARIRALNISTDRLENILADSDSSAEIVAAEDALTQRQAQLEALTSQRTSLGEDVEMARLDIELVQDEQIEEVDPSGFMGGLTRGWNALVGAVNGIVEGAGTALPWVGVALLGYGAVQGWRRIVRSRAGSTRRKSLK